MSIKQININNWAARVVLPSIPNIFRTKTPLDTVEVRDYTYGKMLATPFLFNDNNESGDKCFWTGTNNGDAIWTDRCDAGNSSQGWEFRPVNGNQNRFQLVHKLTGKCAKPTANSIGSNIQSCNCTSNNNMIWTRSDGN